MMLSRRSATLSALAACVTAPHRSWAQPAPAAAGEEAGPVTILRVQRRSIEVNGKPASVLGIRSRMAHRALSQKWESSCRQ